MMTKDVRVVLVKGEMFHICYKNTDRENFQQESEETTYRITQIRKTSSAHWKHWMRGFPTIEIHLPDEVKIVTAYADSNEVIADGLVLDTLEVEVLNGKVSVSNIYSRNMELKCTNGACEASDIKVLEHCEIQVLNGKASLSNSLTEKCGYDISCVNGAVEFLGERESIPFCRDGVPFFKIHCINGMSYVKQSPSTEIQKQ